MIEVAPARANRQGNGEVNRLQRSRRGEESAGAPLNAFGDGPKGEAGDVEEIFNSSPVPLPGGGVLLRSDKYLYRTRPSP